MTRFSKQIGLGTLVVVLVVALLSAVAANAAFVHTEPSNSTFTAAIDPWSTANSCTLCSVATEHDAIQQAARTRYDLLLDDTDTTTWSSESFEWPADPSAATISIDARASIAELLLVGGDVALSVSLIDETDPSSTQLLTTGALVSSDQFNSFSTSVSVDQLQAGHDYRLDVMIVVQSGLGLLGTIEVWFDNVELAAVIPTPPLAATASASGIDFTSATLTGSVDPNGVATSYVFEYGPTAGYGSSTTPLSAGSGDDPVDVSVPVSGLAAGSTYHYRLVTSSDDGSSEGGDENFATSSAEPPAVSDQTGVAGGAAGTLVVSATIDPRGADTTWWIEYGTTLALGDTVLGGVVLAGAGPTTVQHTLTDLPAGTPIHFRIVLSSDAGELTTDPGNAATGGTPDSGGGAPRVPEGACTIYGGAGNDTLIGTAGRDIICGLGGNDVIRGGGGNDVIYGGDGNDRLLGEGGSDLIRGGSGNDRINGGAGRDRLFGDAGNDIMVGGTGNDVMRGGSGNDRLSGQSGNDRIFGDGGNDSLLGGAGHDKLGGQAGRDRLVGGPGTDAIGGGTGNDRISGSAGNDRLYGGAGNDVIAGNAGADRLYGQAGRDRLLGGTGNDLLRGGPGRDVVRGGPGRNTVRQ